MVNGHGNLVLAAIDDYRSVRRADSDATGLRAHNADV